MHQEPPIDHKEPNDEFTDIFIRFFETSQGDYELAVTFLNDNKDRLISIINDNEQIRRLVMTSRSSNFIAGFREVIEKTRPELSILPNEYIVLVQKVFGEEKIDRFVELFNKINVHKNLAQQWDNHNNLSLMPLEQFDPSFYMLMRGLIEFCTYVRRILDMD